MTQTISHHAAMIYLMVLVSASDADMSDKEMLRIGEIVKRYPVFDGFDCERLVPVAEECGAIMGEENGGLQAVLGLAKEAIPTHLTETAYAMAVEVAEADNRCGPEVLRVLELIRHSLQIDRLFAGAIERSARARHMRP